ncbi:hypothetical protein AgCh_011855 [Apium graveolens]
MTIEEVVASLKVHEERIKGKVENKDKLKEALLLAKCTKEESRKLRVDGCEIVKALLSRSGGEINVWYLNNGASNHMTCFKEKFARLDENVTGQVHFRDGTTVKIEEKETVIMMCKNGEERLLHDVYYIPNLRNNIVSLGQMSEDGNEVVLRGEYLWVRDKDDQLLMKVKRLPNHLYKIVIETKIQECFLNKVDEIARLWHRRLGHVNYQEIHLMSKETMVKGLPKIKMSSGVCDGCLMSKHARKKFPRKVSYEVSQVLELVHGDLCGPIDP